MKLPKHLLIKDTIKLFNNKYQNKVVIVSPIASLLRGKNYNYALSALSKHGKPFFFKIKEDEKVYALKLISELKLFDQEEFAIRIESPYINVYTNNNKHVETLTNLDPEKVKYISIPNKNNPPLEQGKVITKHINHKYKIFLGTTHRDHKSFLSWAEHNSRVKLTKKCQKDLSKSYSFGGSYFYVMDEKLLTMVKMFLGSDISRIESVIKA